MKGTDLSLNIPEPRLSLNSRLANDETVQAMADRRVLATSHASEFKHRQRLEGELSDAIETAKAADKIKNDVLAEVNNEVLTALHVLLSTLQRMQEDLSYPKHQECIRTALQTGQSALDLLNNLINISHTSSCGLRHTESPKAPAAAHTNASKSNPSSSVRRAQTQILLVNNIDENCLAVKSMISQFGLNIQTASDGYAAISAVNQFTYDMVLIDMSMLGIDGFQTARAIRQLPGPAAWVPLIAIAANTGHSDKQRLLDAGLDDYLSKPVARDQLARVIARWVTPRISANGKADLIAPRSQKGELTMADTDQPDDLDNSNNTDNEESPSLLLSVSALEQLARDTDPEIVPQLIAVFLEDAHSRVAKLGQAIETNDYTVIAAEAHAFGSSAATFGLPEIHRLASQCEHLLREANHTDGLRLASSLITLAGPGLEALSSYAQGLNPEGTA